MINRTRRCTFNANSGAISGNPCITPTRQEHSSHCQGIADITQSVRKYLRNIAMTPSYSKRIDRLSKLDPFKAYLKERIDAAKPDWIPATVLFREIQAKGYEGKEGILKNYIRPFKIIPSEPIRRFV